MTFQQRDVGMVGQAVEQGGDGGSVGKDGVPFFKISVGGDDNGTALVAAVDHFIEQVGGIVVVGEIGQFIDHQQVETGIAL